MTRFALLALLTLLAAPAFAATSYFSALPELPLPPALTENTESAVRFDQPQGRIIVLQATGTQQDNDIKAFYSKTLPALGWTQHEGMRFTRGKETLILDVKPTGNGLNRLNILLKPQE